MIISDRMDANKKSKMLPRDQKLLPKIGVFLVFQKYLKQAGAELCQTQVSYTLNL